MVPSFKHPVNLAQFVANFDDATTIWQRKERTLFVWKWTFPLGRVHCVALVAGKNMANSSRQIYSVVFFSMAAVPSGFQSKRNGSTQDLYSSRTLDTNTHLISHISTYIYIYIYMLAPPPGPTFWFLWVYAGLVTFHYQFFSCFLSICSFCTLLASKCSFWVSICRVLCIAGSQNHAFLASHAGCGEVQVTKPAEGLLFWSEQSSNLNRNPVLIFLLFYLTEE